MSESDVNTWPQASGQASRVGEILICHLRLCASAGGWSTARTLGQQVFEIETCKAHIISVFTSDAEPCSILMQSPATF